MDSSPEDKVGILFALSEVTVAAFSLVGMFVVKLIRKGEVDMVESESESVSELMRTVVRSSLSDAGAGVAVCGGISSLELSGRWIGGEE